MSGRHPYLLSHNAEKLENVFIENFQKQKQVTENMLSLDKWGFKKRG